MDALTMAAASGMRSRMEALDLLANNVANASAPGFKADREFYNQYLSAEASTSPDGGIAPSLPVIEQAWTDFSQGTLVPTGGALDIAINGNGFFTAAAPSGIVYTRTGNLRISPQGELQTQEGYPVQNTKGTSIVVNGAKPIEITRDGIVRQDGQDVARIALVDFNDVSSLSKRGYAYFSSDATPQPASPELQQGKLESSNSQPADNAIRLVSVLRQFEMLQRAMSIGTDMNRRVLDEVARVTS